MSAVAKSPYDGESPCPPDAKYTLERLRPGTSSIRGICNLSGVSCHISASLQLVYHGMPELRVLLPRAANAWSGILQGRGTANGGNATKKRPTSPPSSPSIEFVHRLGLLFEKLSPDHSSPVGPVDPIDVYETLPPTIDYRNVGDAATALRVILVTIKAGLEEMHELLKDQRVRMRSEDELDALTDMKEILQRCVDGSSIQWVEGTKTSIDETADGRQVKKQTTREKPGKERPWSVPFPLPVRGYDTLLASLRSVTIEPQVIVGYNWDEAVSFTENEVEIGACISSDDRSDSSSTSYEDDESSTVSSSDSTSSSLSLSSTTDSSLSTSSSLSTKDDDESGGNWKTRKYTALKKLPTHLIFHLKRFDYRQNKVHKISSALDVPAEIDMRPYLRCQEQSNLANEVRHSNSHNSGSTESNVDAEHPCDLLHHHYTLRGAIVHIDTPPLPDEHGNDIDEGGHYIAYVHSTDDLSQDKKDLQHIQRKMSKCNLDDLQKEEHWIRIDDEDVMQVMSSERNANKDVLNILSGRTSIRSKAEDEVNGKQGDRRYATILLYSRQVSLGSKQR